MTRYILIYRTAKGDPMFLTGLGRVALDLILAAQTELGSTDFEWVQDRGPWLQWHPEFVAYYPGLPLTWEQCRALVALHRGYDQNGRPVRPAAAHDDWKFRL